MAEGEGSAVVMFSGGQDSTACLAWALEKFERVETVGFDYRQRHRIELDCRPRILERIRKTFPHWAGKLGPDHMIDLGVMGEISDSALTRETEIKLQKDGLPSTFVPGRNLAFLTFGAMVAYRRSARHIVGGMCETDYSGYPDCRDDAIKAMQVALSIGMDRRFTLHTPLMWIDKAETWRLTHLLGGEELVEITREESHSCYLGDRTTIHDWGRGCGTCPACELRRAGYEKYRAAP